MWTSREPRSFRECGPSSPERMFRKESSAYPFEMKMAIGEVRYIGDAVAAVAAVDEDTADEALGLIDVEYEELPAVFDVEEAMRDGAPLVHQDMADYSCRKVYLASWNPVKGTNIIHQASNQRGDVEAALKRADYVFEVLSGRVRFITVTWNRTQSWPTVKPAQSPFGVVPRKSFSFGQSSRRPSACRRASFSDLHEGRRRVRRQDRSAPGTLCRGTGAQGWQADQSCHDADRGINAAAGSTPAVVRLKTGVKKDGTLVARDIHFIWDTGAYAEGLAPSNRAMKDGIGPYRIPDIRVTSTLVFTNKIRGTQLRGLGVPEGYWAIESQTDMIAERLGLDPLEFRMKNILEDGDINSIGDVVEHCGLKECLRRAAEGIAWGKPKAKNIGRESWSSPNRPRRNPAYRRHVHLNEDGSAQVLVGASEIGQGMEVVMSQITAEELGIPIEAVGIKSADTAVTPYDRGTFSSRVTFYAGMAVKKAAEDAKNQLLELASKITEIPVGELAVENQRI